jgi:hypothetical protein
MPARFDAVTESLNILRLMSNLFVALVRLNDGPVDVGEPLMVLMLHQSSVSTLSENYGHGS